MDTKTLIEKIKGINYKAFMPVLFCLLLIALFTSMNPRFFSVDNFSTLLRQSSILLIISLSMNFVILAGSIDLSLGQSVSIAGVASALLVNELGYGVIFVGLAVGMLVGLMNGCIHVFGKMPSFLTTLATASILSGLTLIISGGQPIPLRVDWFTAIANNTIIPHIPNIFIWAVLLYAISIFIQFRTKFGRQLFAVGGGEYIAALSGVNVKKVKILAFTTGGTIGGLAGVLLSSRLGAAHSNMGEPFLMLAVASVVIGGTSLTGGVGGVHRNILGVIVIAMLSNGMDVVGIHPHIQVLIRGVVIIMAVIFSMDRSKITVFK